MSDPRSILAPVWHPWRAIRHRPDITVRWRRLDGRMGEWCESTRTMTLDPRQTQAERRVTACHEAIHAERHDRGCDPRTELRVRKETARRLVCIHRLADALLFWGDDLVNVADECWVDVDTLRVRLDHLHPAERGYLIGRLAAREETA